MIRLSNKTAPGPSPVRAYDFSAIESVAEFKSIAKDADIVWAVPLANEGNPCIVYGSAALREIILGGEPVPLKVVAFCLNFQTDHVEHLLAALQVEKGEFEWNGELHRANEGAKTQTSSPLASSTHIFARWLKDQDPKKGRWGRD